MSVVWAQKGFDGLSDGALSRALAPSVYCASCGHRLIRDYRRELIVCYLLSGRVYFAFHQKAGEDDLFLARLSAGAMGQRPFAFVVGELGDKEALPVLAKALEDSDPAVQYRAVGALKKVSGRDLGDDVNKWREWAADPDGSSAEWSIAEEFRKVF